MAVTLFDKAYEFQKRMDSPRRVFNFYMISAGTCVSRALDYMHDPKFRVGTADSREGTGLSAFLGKGLSIGDFAPSDDGKILVPAEHNPNRLLWVAKKDSKASDAHEHEPFACIQPSKGVYDPVYIVYFKAGAELVRDFAKHFSQIATN